MITGSPLVSASFMGKQSPPYRRGKISASKPAYSRHDHLAPMSPT